jgi:hypothetical protein
MSENPRIFGPEFTTFDVRTPDGVRIHGTQRREGPPLLCCTGTRRAT